MSHAEIIFNDIDSALNEGSVSVKIAPMLSTAGNTGAKAEIFVRVSINGSAVGGSGAWRVTGTDMSRRAFVSYRFMTNPLEPLGTVFAA